MSDVSHYKKKGVNGLDKDCPCVSAYWDLTWHNWKAIKIIFMSTKSQIQEAKPKVQGKTQLVLKAEYLRRVWAGLTCNLCCIDLI